MAGMKPLPDGTGDRTGNLQRISGPHAALLTKIGEGRKTVRRAASALVLCAILAFAAAAQEGGLGTLSGVVLNAKGGPVEGARVIMQSASGGAPDAARTNSSGRFFFPQLARGYYDVRASFAGKSTDWKHNIEVRTGKETNVTLRLSRTGKRS
jgi:Carboxypeptidase regulatory-like domain